MTDFQELDDDPFSASDSMNDGDGGQTGIGGGSGPVGRLFDGNAEGPDVPTLQGDYGLSRPWAMVCRGTLRVATGSGVPPIFEIVAGSAMGLMAAQDGDGASGVLPSSDSTDDREEGDGGADPSAGSPPPVQ